MLATAASADMPAAVIQTSVIDARAIARKVLWTRTFVPVYNREVRHARRVEMRTFPLLSRYFFAWIEPDEVGKIKRLKGVVDVLRKAGSTDPSYVPQSALDLLLNEPIVDFNEGDHLIVVRGQWEGLQGLFSRREDDRVIFMISMLGREIPHSVPAHHVSKIRE